MVSERLATAQEEIATLSAELFRLGESLTRVTEDSTRSASGRIGETLRVAEQRVSEVADALSRVSQEAAAGASGVLANALSSAEKRVATLNEALGERAEEAARNAIGQFETMRLAAVSEGQRAMEGVQAARLALEERVREATNATGEELRAAASGLVGEVTTAVSEATRRFATTADELRRAAQEMQRELSETRADLQKGVLDMPAEAVEASTSMRRAIAEQIDAINELAKIVARSAGEGLSHRPAPAMPQATGLPPAAGLPPAQPAARLEQKPPPPPAQTAPAQPFGRPAGATPINTVEAAGEAPAAEAAASRAGAVKPRGRNGEARGWVADLLRRASSSETPAARPDETEAPETPPAPAAATVKRSPAQVVESLNSLSIDIARAIDHEASVELWDRYKRGERNVFTRRLYTLQGQKTFDELRKKYERDGDFKKAVDNYIGDFERLLSQVSKDGSDPNVSRMYLTSDTGKVYTMLAHAAGRLE
jgi:hypothetical protein